VVETRLKVVWTCREKTCGCKESRSDVGESYHMVDQEKLYEKLLEWYKDKWVGERHDFLKNTMTLVDS